MKLFYSANSPYARKCRLVLRERGIIGCTEISVNALDNPPELILANPLCKVPTLVMNDGDSLCDSSVIVEYLDGLNGAPLLIPVSGKARFDVLGVATLADGVMDMAVEWVVQTRRPKQEQWPDWIERRCEAILRTLKFIALSDILKKNDIALAHINVACALAYLDFRHPTLKWRQEVPLLAQFLDGFYLRESMKETAPKS